MSASIFIVRTNKRGGAKRREKYTQTHTIIIITIRYNAINGNNHNNNQWMNIKRTILICILIWYFCSDVDACVFCYCSIQFFCGIDRHINWFGRLVCWLISPHSLAHWYLCVSQFILSIMSYDTSRLRTAQSLVYTKEKIEYNDHYSQSIASNRKP